MKQRYSHVAAQPQTIAEPHVPRREALCVPPQKATLCLAAKSQQNRLSLLPSGTENIFG